MASVSSVQIDLADLAATAGGTHASVATGIYIPPLATGSISDPTTASTTRSSSNSLDDQTYLRYFLEPYLVAHELSWPSFRYAYFLWFAVGGVLVLWAVAHILTRRSGGGVVSAWLRKRTVRRIGFGGMRTNMVYLPTIGQMILMVGILVAVFAFSFVGDDYIDPKTCVFGGKCIAQVSQGPPKSTFDVTRIKRSIVQPVLDDRSVAAPLPAGLPVRQERALAPRETTLNPSGWAPFNDPLLASPNYNIFKNFWTSSSRLGLVVFALVPLITTLALKLWPYAIFSIPRLTDYGFDKSALFHRWLGRIAWVLSSAHVGLWTKQLFTDRDPYGSFVFWAVWQHWRFNAGVVAYVALTATVIVSFNPLRSRYYEFFYYSHIVLSVLFLVGCMLHYYYLMEWAIIALALWGAERATRFGIWLYINGFFHGLRFSDRPPHLPAKRRAARFEGGEKCLPPAPAMDWHDQTSASEWDYSKSNHSSLTLHGDPLAPSLYAYGPGEEDAQRHSHLPPGARPAHLPAPLSFYLAPSTRPSRSPLATLSPLPPPGFAYAQLLPGRTVRLVLRIPRTIRWKAGQYTLLTLPSVKWWQSHPYTIANVDERTFRSDPEPGSTLVFLIRVRRGFTRTLWKDIVNRRRAALAAGDDTTSGILLRAQVGLAIGSASRTNWALFSSVMIICGGTGVSFGTAILEHVCQQMAARGGVAAADFRPIHVRFVWILQEYAHLSWIAPTVRRCLHLCSPEELCVEFFVTRERHYPPIAYSTSDDNLVLRPPPHFLGQSSAEPRESMDSLIGESRGLATPNESELDFVLFDGEEYSRTAAEVEVSQTVRREGKIRRALSRRECGDRFLNFPSLAPSSDKPHSYPPLSSHGVPSFHFHPPLKRAPSPGYEQAHSPLVEDVNGSSTFSDHRPSHEARHAEPLPDSDWDLVDTYGGRDSAVNSTRGLMNQSDTDFRSLAPLKDEVDDLALDIDDSDLEDLHVVSELAREGRPDLGRLMDEEIARARGRSIVACCGPTSLNAFVRGLVADRIKPARIARGDSSGDISLVVEDFET